MFPIRLSAPAFAVALIVALLFCIRNTSASPLLPVDDTTPPTLVWLTIEPETIDTSAGPAPITITARITDDWQGFQQLVTTYRAGLVTDYQFSFTLDKYARIQGDALDGVYRIQTVTRDDVVPGSYPVYAVGIRDIRYNTDKFLRDSTPSVYSLPLPLSFCVDCSRVFLPTISLQP